MAKLETQIRKTYAKARDIMQYGHNGNHQIYLNTLLRHIQRLEDRYEKQFHVRYNHFCGESMR
jgi:hypothetical protein